MSAFAACVLAIVALSLLGLPIGHAMIASSILYLYLKGIDLGTAAEQLLNGMYSSYLLLAIPLFILAAEFMNSGSIMDRLLRFCNALVGRFRGGLAQVNVVQSIIFASMSGSALADAAGSGKLMQSLMTRDGKYPAAFAAALTEIEIGSGHLRLAWKAKDGVLALRLAGPKEYDGSLAKRLRSGDALPPQPPAREDVIRAFRGG